MVPDISPLFRIPFTHYFLGKYYNKFMFCLMRKVWNGGGYQYNEI